MRLILTAAFFTYWIILFGSEIAQTILLCYYSFSRQYLDKLFEREVANTRREREHYLSKMYHYIWTINLTSISSNQHVDVADAVIISTNTSAELNGTIVTRQANSPLNPLLNHNLPSGQWFETSTMSYSIAPARHALCTMISNLSQVDKYSFVIKPEVHTKEFSLCNRLGLIERNYNALLVAANLAKVKITKENIKIHLLRLFHHQYRKGP